MELTFLKDIPPWEWPPDAGEIFLETLRDHQADESDRLIAAELGGDFTVINDELAAALLSVVRNGDESVEMRANAAIALGPALEQADIEEFVLPEQVPISESTFHEIQRTFRNFHTDANVPKEVRRRILEASVRAPQDWHGDAIRTAYSSAR